MVCEPDDGFRNGEGVLCSSSLQRLGERGSPFEMLFWGGCMNGRILYFLIMVCLVGASVHCADGGQVLQIPFALEPQNAPQQVVMGQQEPPQSCVACVCEECGTVWYLCVRDAMCWCACPDREAGQVSHSGRESEGGGNEWQIYVEGCRQSLRSTEVPCSACCSRECYHSTLEAVVFASCCAIVVIPITAVCFVPCCCVHRCMDPVPAGADYTRDPMSW